MDRPLDQQQAEQDHGTAVFPGDNIIFTNVRHESEFLIEWLNYHLWIGFDHVVIYCQEDSEKDAEALREKLRAYVDQQLVTVIHWARTADQMGAIEEFMDKHQRPGQRVLLIDVDEFLVLCEHATVGDFLASMSHKSNECIHFAWLMFGTSHIAHHPAGMPVMTTYHLRQSKAEKYGQINKGKVFLLSPAKLRPNHRPAMHHDCNQWQNVSRHDIHFESARLHHYTLRGGIQDAYARRRNRGYDFVFRTAIKYFKEDRDVREDYEGRNEVSDASMLNIFSEYPAGGLMLAQPPSTRRAVPTKCEKPISWNPHGRS